MSLTTCREIRSYLNQLNFFHLLIKRYYEKSLSVQKIQNEYITRQSIRQVWRNTINAKRKQLKWILYKWPVTSSLYQMELDDIACISKHLKDDLLDYYQLKDKITYLQYDLLAEQECITKKFHSLQMYFNNLNFNIIDDFCANNNNNNNNSDNDDDNDDTAAADHHHLKEISICSSISSDTLDAKVKKQLDEYSKDLYNVYMDCNFVTFHRQGLIKRSVNLK